MRKFIRKFLVVLTVLVVLATIWLIFYIPHHFNFNNYAWYAFPYFFTSITVIFGEIGFAINFSVDYDYEPEKLKY